MNVSIAEERCYGWVWLLMEDHLLDDPNHPNIDVYKVQGFNGTELKTVQQFDIFGSVGKIPEWMGLAIWPNTL